jgi:hypothetical protein
MPVSITVQEISPWSSSSLTSTSELYRWTGHVSNFYWPVLFFVTLLPLLSVKF